MFSMKCVTAWLLSASVLVNAERSTGNLRKLQDVPVPMLVTEVPELYGQGGTPEPTSEAMPDLYGDDGLGIPDFFGGGGQGETGQWGTDPVGALQDMMCEFLPFFCSGQQASTSICPVVTPLATLDLERYISSSWYVQKQQINPYQSENQLYCVVATYENASDGWLYVNNYGNNDKVNGPQQNTTLDMLGMESMSFQSMARQGGVAFEGFDENMSFPSGVVVEIGMDNLTESQVAQLEALTKVCAEQIQGGQLQVAPCIFQPIFDYVAGQYWVLAVDEVDYSWAIVSGGQPDQVKQTDPTPLCTTKEGSSFLDVNGSGLWLFTRDPVADPAVIQAMEDKLGEMGVYAGDLKPVAQEGCKYEGALIKSAQGTTVTGTVPAN